MEQRAESIANVTYTAPTETGEVETTVDAQTVAQQALPEDNTGFGPCFHWRATVFRIIGRSFLRKTFMPVNLVAPVAADLHPIAGVRIGVAEAGLLRHIPLAHVATMNEKFERLVERAEQLIARIESVLPQPLGAPDWSASIAWRYRKRSSGHGTLEPVRHVGAMRLADLKEIDPQKEKIERNTQQFVQGKPANNVLLTGARGTGKSSLIKACLNAYAAEGLRLIEVDKADLTDLPDIVDVVSDRPEKFIVFCDDLSFEDGEPGYKALKSILDGSVAAATPNVLIYATSNRRHLLPEYMADNLTYTHTEDGEVHPGEVVEEKISLSERFGLWVSFYPFSQQEYLTIVAQWLSSFGVPAQAIEEARPEALVWALERGSRSGRVAYQFAHSVPATAERKHTEVAVGILLRADGAMLLSTRPPGKPYAGVWKVTEHDYPHALVRLHWCKVWEWTGEFEMREGQAMAWQQMPITVSPVLPGAYPVLQWLAEERGLQSAVG
eukprot:gene9778-9845_t